MAEYVLSNRAVQDFSEIWNYTFDEWSEEQANNYYWMLLSQCERVANNPQVGKSYSEFAVGLRGLKVSRHIIFFRSISTSTVEITRILHERMNPKSGMKSQ